MSAKCNRITEILTHFKSMHVDHGQNHLGGRLLVVTSDDFRSETSNPSCKGLVSSFGRGSTARRHGAMTRTDVAGAKTPAKFTVIPWSILIFPGTLRSDPLPIEQTVRCWLPSWRCGALSSRQGDRLKTRSAIWLPPRARRTAGFARRGLRVPGASLRGSSRRTIAARRTP